ncbi:MAG: hypothetical protein ABI839_07670 [Verrucomicrobiota bacterium]
MIYVQDGLFVRIEQLEAALAPAPRPLNHGFNTRTAYRVLGCFSLAESAEAFFILSNDRDEIWFISNRHLRTCELDAKNSLLRKPLAAVMRPHVAVA